MAAGYLLSKRFGIQKINVKFEKLLNRSYDHFHSFQLSSSIAMKLMNASQVNYVVTLILQSSLYPLIRAHIPCTYIAARSHLRTIGHIAGVRALFSARELQVFKIDVLSLYQNSLSLGWEKEGTKDPEYSSSECFGYAQA